MNPDKCIICGSNECKKKQHSEEVFKFRYICKYCGKYDIEDDFNIDEFLKSLKKYSFKNFQKDKFKIQFYIREQNDEFNETPYLTEEKINTILDLPNKSIKEQFDLFIKNIDLYYGILKIKCFIGTCEEKDYIKILRIKSYIENEKLFREILNKAKEKSFIKVLYNKYNANEVKNIYLTFDGIEYRENLLYKNQNSKKIFLAFKFDDELNKIFNETISDMIRNLGLNPMIVNQDTTSHDEKISDRIIGEIKSSKILIADLTHHSQNVYYEIGYAMGMGIPIILTSKKDFMQNVAFDINQYPVFEWEDENELKEKIENRIKVLL